MCDGCLYLVTINFKKNSANSTVDWPREKRRRCTWWAPRSSFCYSYQFTFLRSAKGKRGACWIANGYTLGNYLIHRTCNSQMWETKWRKCEWVSVNTSRLHEGSKDCSFTRGYPSTDTCFWYIHDRKRFNGQNICDSDNLKDLIYCRYYQTRCYNLLELGSGIKGDRAPSRILPDPRLSPHICSSRCFLRYL